MSIVVCGFIEIDHNMKTSGTVYPSGKAIPNMGDPLALLNGAGAIVSA